MSQGDPFRELHAPKPSFGEACVNSARTGLTVGLAGALVIGLFTAAIRAAGDGPLELQGIFYRSAIWALVLFAGAFGLALLAHSRDLLDRTFRAAAFCATFFGLGMVLVFFAALVQQCGKYFESTPALVEERNALLKERAADAQAIINREMKDIDRQMNDELKIASTDAERTQIRKDYEEIKAMKKKDLAITLKEYVTAADRDVRQDTSSTALLGHFLRAGPSSEPQDAGIWPALLGSIWLALITLLIAVPLGVGAAVYLEEYRSSGILARIIQININNLAGVPSVVFGILGAFVFVELFFKNLEGELYTPYFLQLILGEHRADRLVHAVFGERIAARNVLGGGMTLALLTLPIIIVSSQEAIRAVPVSIRHGALALGATHWQVVWHHVLPQARPGILTGTILAMSRAMGEAAPLVLFGALLFVGQEPSLFSRFTILPMQIFGWAGRPEDAWRHNAAMASIVLMIALLALNGLAIYLRYRGQRQLQ